MAAPTIMSSLSDFLQALTGIAVSLFHSLLVVFQAFLALGQNIISNVLQFGQSIVKLALDLLQGIIGFILANTVAIVVLGGAYYLCTTRQKKRRSIRKG